MPITREILAASLCDAMCGDGAWARTPYHDWFRWLHRADDVLNTLAQRGWMVVEIEDGERVDAG